MSESGKFARLVADFVATVHEHGGVVRTQSACLELEGRIQVIATRLGATADAVLRTCLRDDWGRQVASGVVADLKRRTPTVYHRGPEYLHVRVATELLAGLALAMLYAAHHGTGGAPGLDLHSAAEAAAGLGAVLSNLPPEGRLVAADSQIIGWIRTTLAAFADRHLEAAGPLCPCGGRHSRPDADAVPLVSGSAALPSAWALMSSIWPGRG